jgi:hypothetical protein
MLTMSPGLSRHEEMLDTGSEACSVDRSIRDARRVDPVVPQGRNLSVPRLGAMKTQSMVHNNREGVSDSGSVPRPEDTGALMDHRYFSVGAPAMTTGEILLLLGSGGLVGPSSRCKSQG